MMGVSHETSMQMTSPLSAFPDKQESLGTLMPNDSLHLYWVKQTRARTAFDESVSIQLKAAAIGETHSPVETPSLQLSIGLAWPASVNIEASPLI